MLVIRMVVLPLSLACCSRAKLSVAEDAVSVPNVSVCSASPSPLVRACRKPLTALGLGTGFIPPHPFSIGDNVCTQLLVLF